MRRMTGSSVGLAIACPASHALPQAFTEVGIAAERGSAIHAYIRDALEHGEEKAIASVPKEFLSDAMTTDLGAIRDLIGNDDPDFEVSFALDVVTGKARMLGTNLGRNYGELAENEIAMTADLVVDCGSTGVVADWKTGHHAADPWQLRVLSIAAADFYGWSDVRGVFAYRQDDGTWKPYVEEYSTMDLDAHFAQLRDTAMTVRHIAETYADGDGNTPNVTEGKHCTYCPAKLACPAHVARLTALSGNPLVKGETRALTPATLGALYPQIRFYEQQLKAAKEYIEGIAKEQPIPLGNGAVLKGVEVQREYIDGAKAHALIAATHGIEAANQACEMKASKESIKRALGKKATEAINEIRNAGGIRTTTAVYAREVKE